MSRPDGAATWRGASSEPSVSGDGTTVVFSTTPELDPTAPTGGHRQVVSVDRVDGRVTTVSASAARTAGSGHSKMPRHLSADGSTVALLEVTSPETPERVRRLVMWHHPTGAAAEIATRREWTQTPTWRGDGADLSRDGSVVVYDADTPNAAPLPSVLRWERCA